MSLAPITCRRCGLQLPHDDEECRLHTPRPEDRDRMKARIAELEASLASAVAYLRAQVARYELEAEQLAPERPDVADQVATLAQIIRSLAGDIERGEHLEDA